MELIDRAGLEAVSMRGLGHELGVEAMSLYRHVDGKAAVLDGIFERILAELPQPAPARSWRASLRAAAGDLRRVLRGHPKAVSLFVSRPAATLGSLAHVEWVLGVLRDAGFRPDAALGTLNVLIAYIIGHTMATYPPHSAETSFPPCDRLSGARFPRVREAARLLDGHDFEAEFELGLDALLAGIKSAHARRKP